MTKQSSVAYKKQSDFTVRQAISFRKEAIIDSKCKAFQQMVLVIKKWLPILGNHFQYNDQLVRTPSVSLSKMCNFDKSKATLMLSPVFAVVLGFTLAVNLLPSATRYR